MSRKHYIAIAAALRNITDAATRRKVIGELLPLLKRDARKYRRCPERRLTVWTAGLLSGGPDHCAFFS